MYSEEERERESAQGVKVKEREGTGNLAHKVMRPLILHAMYQIHGKHDKY